MIRQNIPVRDDVLLADVDKMTWTVCWNELSMQVLFRRIRALWPLANVVLTMIDCNFLLLTLSSGALSFNFSSHGKCSSLCFCIHALLMRTLSAFYDHI